MKTAIASQMIAYCLSVQSRCNVEDLPDQCRIHVFVLAISNVKAVAVIILSAKTNWNWEVVVGLILVRIFVFVVVRVAHTIIVLSPLDKLTFFIS